MELPKIDREGIDFTSDTEVCNIGYNEGIYNDRPYRIEVWSSYDIDVATVFISNINLDEDSIRKYLIDSNIVNIIDKAIKERRGEEKTEAAEGLSCGEITTIESDDNEFYSINIPLKDRNKIYNEIKIDLKSFDF